MKVCVLTTGYPRFQGDLFGIFIYKLTKELVSEHVDVIVIAPDDPITQKEEIIEGIRIKRFQYFPFRAYQRLAYGSSGIMENIRTNILVIFQIPFFLISQFLAGLISTKDCDIIHANWIICGLVGIWIRFFREIPVVLTVHNTRLRDYPKWLSRFVIKNVDAVISPHPELTELVHRYGSKKLVEIPNLVIPDMGTSKQRDVVIKELNITSPIVISFIARLVDWKDPLTFVKAIPLILKKRDVNFLIVGDGPLMKEVKELVDNYSFNNKVKVLGMRRDIYDLLSITTIFTGLSTIENIWSSTVIEAVFHKACLILTDVGTTSKVFTHLQDAYLIEPQHENALAQAVLELIDNKDLRTNLSRKAHELLIRKGFVKKKIIGNTIYLYKELISI